VTTGAVLIGTAVLAVAFGLLAWWRSRRKGLRAAGLATFLGIAAVYTGFWGVLEHVGWLYVPCVVLILASYAIRFAAQHRSASRDKVARAPDTTQDPE
jgi:hypothetical protein